MNVEEVKAEFERRLGNSTNNIAANGTIYRPTWAQHKAAARRVCRQLTVEQIDVLYDSVQTAKTTGSRDWYETYLVLKKLRVEKDRLLVATLARKAAA